MPVPGNRARAGSVPLDSIGAEEIAGLLGAVTAALAGEPGAETACADAGPRLAR